MSCRCLADFLSVSFAWYRQGMNGKGIVNVNGLRYIHFNGNMDSVMYILTAIGIVLYTF